MDVSTLVASVSSAAELAKLLVNERDRQKAAAIEGQFTDKITQAQIQLSQVLGTVIEKDGLIQTLTERVRELEAEQSEKSRYRLAKLGTLGDFFAYELRPAAELVERADEPAHFICQPCLDIRKQKSILRIQGTLCVCASCGSKVQIEPSNPVAPHLFRSDHDPFARNW
ncbi:hypothetical protein [Comamonas terrigena]|uniref:hypothetical protein n=1 Tax=Comamonas terrigena TaxID=32013 RepID=UPI0028A72E2F|nr:hypothetical protein [Comamonas terrigena]